VGKLRQIGKLIIRVYANDHLPPHFHAIAPDFEALIEIETSMIMRGRLPPQARKAVMAWAARNRASITDEWNRINPRFPIASEDRMDKTPRVERVAARGPTTLRIKWRRGPSGDVDLAGWIATGGDILARLNNPDLFRKARIADYGSAVTWDDDDLRIDAVHLEQLGLEQRPFGAKEAAEWQRTMQLSNHEAAALLGIAVSTWNAYKAQGKIPSAIAMLCRAARRDPIMMHAHFRPRRTAGRPRKIA
jgi:hypothetical protein